MDENQSEKRYRAFLLSFRIANTLELTNGRCACISCQKLFRSVEYLNMHFERAHALELQELEHRSKTETGSVQDLFIPRHKKLSYEHNSRNEVITGDGENMGMSAIQRAERQMYADLDNSKDE